MSSKVLILGNPILREKSECVFDFECKEIKENIEELKEELERFRKENGFGRGIAAIQIGIKKRIIALNLGHGPFCIINPEITFRSGETFKMWDDCMSFPELIVKVTRNESISIEYFDEEGKEKTWNNLSRDISELLQHEIDHLDGILAIDRAIEKNDIIYKNEYLKNKTLYDRDIDYIIKKTIEN
jgi:peptide deformylase